VCDLKSGALQASWGMSVGVVVYLTCLVWAAFKLCRRRPIALKMGRNRKYCQVNRSIGY
jgi:hypothetical protein